MLTVDLHAGQIQGFFNIPVDNLYAMPVLLQDLRSGWRTARSRSISPDAGGVERARAFSKRLDAHLAIIDKRRAAPTSWSEMHIIGDVEGRDAIIVDDMVDTAGTLCTAAEAVVRAGAPHVLACATHAVLSGPAIERIEASAHRGARRHRHHPAPSEAARSCGKIKVLPGRAAARRGHPAHPQGRIDQLAIRLRV